MKKYVLLSPELEFMWHRQVDDHCARCKLKWPCPWTKVQIGHRQYLWVDMFNSYVRRM